MIPTSKKSANDKWSYRLSLGPLTGIARIFEGERLVGDLTTSWPDVYGSEAQKARMNLLDGDAQTIVDKMNA